MPGCSQSMIPTGETGAWAIPSHCHLRGCGYHDPVTVTKTRLSFVASIAAALVPLDITQMIPRGTRSSVAARQFLHRLHGSRPLPLRLSRRLSVQNSPSSRTVSALCVSWLWNDPDVWTWSFPTFRIGVASPFVGHRSGDDHVLSVLTVHGRRHLVLGGQLE